MIATAIGPITTIGMADIIDRRRWSIQARMVDMPITRRQWFMGPVSASAFRFTNGWR